VVSGIREAVGTKVIDAGERRSQDPEVLGVTIGRGDVFARESEKASLIEAAALTGAVGVEGAYATRRIVGCTRLVCCGALEGWVEQAASTTAAIRVVSSGIDRFM